jgi:GNAT superfamily N-acetyltransferase
MAEFWGDAASVRRQKQLLKRRAQYANMSWLAGGGRIIIVTDLDPVHWPATRSFVEEDGVVGPVLVPEADARRWVADHLPGWSLFVWDAYLAPAATILTAAEAVLAARALPDGWSAEATKAPTDDQIDAVQSLCQTAGVSPMPAHAHRGALFPSLTAMIRDNDGQLMATAWAGKFFHPEGPWGDTAMIGLVAVDPTARGLGVGAFTNAFILRESLAALGWARATEFVARDNPASRAMVAACGLTLDAGLVAGVSMRAEGRFTR